MQTIVWVILVLGLLYIVWSQNNVTRIVTPVILSDDTWYGNYSLGTPWRGGRWGHGGRRGGHRKFHH